MKTLEFNRNPVVFGNTIEDPDNDTIKNTLALWNCSVEDALKFGGDLTRAAIGAMNLRNDKKYIVVDTKTHMLMPGFYPGIPGWHTDGVPRGPEKNPAAKADPDIFAQEEMESARYHLLVTGTHCPTRFVKTPNVKFTVPDEPTPDLYKVLSNSVNFAVERGEVETFDSPASQVLEWDWWAVHTAQAATAHGWRFLIRVTETDHFPPQTDARQIIRTQQQVYAPIQFGW